MSGLRPALLPRLSPAVRPGSARPQVSGFRFQASEPQRRLGDSSRAASRQQRGGFSSGLSSAPSSRRSLGEGGFTIVEVMMAATILVVGFMGMIQAVTMSSEMLATGRRSTVASQILSNEMEKLRLTAWGSLPSSGTATVGIDLQLWPVWTSTRSYAVNEVVTYNSAWYRCIVAATAGQLPTNVTFWTSVTSTASTDLVIREGVTYTLTRITTDFDPDGDGTTDTKEVALTLTWTKGGTTTAANTTTGTWLQKISFSGAAPIARTYTRKSVSWFTKYGLNNAIQR